MAEKFKGREEFRPERQEDWLWRRPCSDCTVSVVELFDIRNGMYRNMRLNRLNISLTIQTQLMY